MPIRPTERARYPKEWPEIRARIRARAGRVQGDIESRVLAYGRFTDVCWEWKGCLSTTGYGRVRIDGRTEYVHRAILAWCLGRSLKKREQVDHKCRNRKCFRPSHLELVTAAENTRRGLVAKLFPKDVRAIIAERAAGATTIELAEKYKVSAAHISRVARGLRYDLKAKDLFE